MPISSAVREELGAQFAKSLKLKNLDKQRRKKKGKKKGEEIINGAN